MIPQLLRRHARPSADTGVEIAREVDGGVLVVIRRNVWASLTQQG